jgi:hypothetical protein
MTRLFLASKSDVKSRLGISDTSYDTSISSILEAVTEEWEAAFNTSFDKEVRKDYFLIPSMSQDKTIVHLKLKSSFIDDSEDVTVYTQTYLVDEDKDATSEEYDDSFGVDYEKGLVSLYYTKPRYVKITYTSGFDSPVASTGSTTGAVVDSFKAVTKGSDGNSISLVFDGVDTVADVISAWNTANTSNTVELVTGSDTDVPESQTLTLSGGSGTDGLYTDVPTWLKEVAINTAILLRTHLPLMNIPEVKDVLKKGSVIHKHGYTIITNKMSMPSGSIRYQKTVVTG